MVRDTEIIIQGRKALVAKEHVKTFLTKQKLVAEASRLNTMVAECPEVLKDLHKTVNKIMRINQKMRRENIFAKFV